ncbi:hypothetical protein 2019_scaffold132_00006 [Bacteriophage sp.]|nr:hypothetical protein 2019_scaffold132_00006 [Bacteriophage sp.]
MSLLLPPVAFRFSFLLTTAASLEFCCDSIQFPPAVSESSHCTALMSFLHRSTVRKS